MSTTANQNDTHWGIHTYIPARRSTNNDGETVNNPFPKIWKAKGDEAIAEETAKTFDYFHTVISTSVSSGLKRRTRSNRKRNRTRVTRRLRGYIMSIDGPNACVALTENNRRYEYEFETSFLRNYGVNSVNQPFELDEIELWDPANGYTVCYKVRPLSEISSVREVRLSEDLQAKLDLLRGF